MALKENTPNCFSCAVKLADLDLCQGTGIYAFDNYSYPSIVRIYVPPQFFPIPVFAEVNLSSLHMRENETEAEWGILGWEADGSSLPDLLQAGVEKYFERSRPQTPRPLQAARNVLVSDRKIVKEARDKSLPGELANSAPTSVAWRREPRGPGLVGSPLTFAELGAFTPKKKLTVIQSSGSNDKVFTEEKFIKVKKAQQNRREEAEVNTQHYHAICRSCYRTHWCLRDDCTLCTHSLGRPVVAKATISREKEYAALAREAKGTIKIRTRCSLRTVPARRTLIPDGVKTQHSPDPLTNNDSRRCQELTSPSEKNLNSDDPQYELMVWSIEDLQGGARARLDGGHGNSKDMR
ncbi:hypothetical protein Bbelb_278220 [Branchiostoma belcheri]|nr:hypothetical protein Bbelb_278220 [Branchiostoma belcheri]